MQIDFEKAGGLVAAIVQDATSGEVLMLAFMNGEAWRHTVDSGFATFWSRSRNKIWLKGETSGHKLAVREILTDCDQDAVLLKVDAIGPGVCHEGYRSCFFRSLNEREWRITGNKGFDPEEVYA
jgi:phosphoribosyl-AMP cyclohydrolase